MGSAPGKRKIDFVMARSDRKRLRIVVEPDLTVRATAPTEATDKEVLAGMKEMPVASSISFR